MDSQATRLGYSMENFRMDVGDVNKDIKTTIKNGTGIELYGSDSAVYGRNLDEFRIMGIRSRYYG